MSRGTRKYVLDTQLFISAFRHPEANDALRRTIVPSADAWHRSGDLLSDLARKEGLEIGRLSKSFANDVLLALPWRESGCVLITDNEHDFQRIRRFVSFEFVKPWPGGLTSLMAQKRRRSRSLERRWAAPALMAFLAAARGPSGTQASLDFL